MPTKHIENELWQKVEDKTVETISQAKIMIKDTDVLHFLVEKGLQCVSTNELVEYALQKKRKGS